MIEKKYHVIHTQLTEVGRFHISLDMVEERGKVYPYSYIQMKKSVGILPFFEGKIVLIRQYRHSLGAYELEIPGGSIEPGCLPEEMAKAELLEETGYKARDIKELGTYFPSPGSSNEVTYLYLADCEWYGVSAREPLEYIEPLLITIEEFRKLVLGGVFKHSMGLIAWLKYEMGGGYKNVDRVFKARF